MEWNVVQKNPMKNFRIALVYPNLYSAGMSNLGLRIVYDLLNGIDGVYCERFFLDHRKSLETGSPLRDFDVIAFCWQFELDAFNIIRIIEEEKIFDKIKIAGGPCCVNPNALREYVDYFYVGEAEFNLISVVRELAEGVDPISTPNVCSPSLNGKVKRAYMMDLDVYFPTRQVMTSKSSFGNAFILEVGRGCVEGCRFCMGGYIFRPGRERQISTIRVILEKALEESSPEKIVVINPSSHYSRMHQLLEIFQDFDVDVSFPSLRPSIVDETVAQFLKKKGQKTVTMAPETSQKVRWFVNKKIQDSEFLQASEHLINAGIRQLKFYVIIGLPGETEEDIESLTNLFKKIRSMGAKVSVSVNPLVPKPHTPFQWLSFISKRDYVQKVRLLKKNLKGYARVEIEEYNSAALQCILARADRKVGTIMKRAYHLGGGLMAIRKSLKEIGLGFKSYLGSLDLNDDLPWDNIKIINKGFLKREYKKTFSGTTTSSCKSECDACRICYL